MANTSPVVLLPLRLEMARKLEEFTISLPGQTPKKGYRRVVCIRWYPDDCQIFPPISEVTAVESDALKKYLDLKSSLTNDQGLSAKTKETKLKEAWGLFVKEVGVTRARLLESGRHPATGKGDAFHQFLAEGAPLKALPSRISLYAVTEQRDIKRNAVIGRTIKRVAEGKQIPSDICFRVSIDPEKTLPWTIDFERAVDEGMGVKIYAPQLIADLEKADWLIAVGWKEDRRTEENTVLEELLLRHMQGGHFEILALETPTNNTEVAQSGYTALEEGTRAALTPPESEHNGKRINAGKILTAAFGLPEGFLSDVKNASLQEQRSAIAMAGALFYGCTHDYMRSSMNYLTPQHTVISMKDRPEEWFQLLWFFISYVTGRGICPSIRIGDNPYGVLPITRIDKQWMPAGEDDTNTAKMQKATANRYDAFKKKFLQVATTAGVGFSTLADAPDDHKFITLLSLLQQDSVPLRVHLQKHFRKENMMPEYSKAPRQLACSLVPREPGAFAELMNICSTGVEELHRGGLSTNSRQRLNRMCSSNAPDASLLERLVSYGVLCLETDLKNGKGTPWEKNVLAYADWLVKELAYLKSINPSELELLLLEMLDTLSSRLDAWAGALAAVKLIQIRPEHEAVLRSPSASRENQIGAYGWLEKPGAALTATSSHGYFQAPSMSQAAACTLLRCAALSGSLDKKEFQVNLSSHRVNEALAYLEGLQSGFSPAELLGYRVERRMKEKGLDDKLEDLRTAYTFNLQGGTEGATRNSWLVNGEKFLNEPRSLPPVEEEIRGELRQLRDSFADLCLAESVYQTSVGNTTRATAWLEAMEGRNVPPEPELIKTQRTGRAQMQKVIYPLETLFTTSSNPRHLADSATTRFCDIHLKPYMNAEFSVSVRSRETGETAYSIPLCPTDLSLEAIDFVVGGQAETEARTRLYLCEYLYTEPNRYKFLGQNFFTNPSYDELEKNAFITIDYGYRAEGKPLFSSLLKAADTVRLFLKSVRALTDEDLAGENPYGPGHSNLENLINLKIKTYLALRDRILLLNDAFSKEKSAIEGGRPDISDLMNLSRLGVPEALNIVPQGDLTQLKGLLVSREGRFQGPPEQVVLDVSAYARCNVKFDPDQRTFSTDSQPEQRPEVKYAAIQALIKSCTDAIKDRIGEAMPVFPPLYPSTPLEISTSTKAQTGEDYLLSLLPDYFGDYALVRKNLKLLLKIMPYSVDGENNAMRVYTEKGIQKSREEAVNEALGKKISPPLSATDIETPLPWKQSAFDIHYILKKSGVSVTANEPFSALVVDEWTDFMSTSHEKTGLAFHFDMPENEAPQAILIAVPPGAEWGKDREAELAEILADTIDLMRIRSVIPEKVAGSALSYLLPALLFEDKTCDFPLAKDDSGTVNRETATGFDYTREDI